MKKILLLLVAATQLAVLGAAERSVKGRVACAGKGVANVVVTDGYNFAQTDDKGRYTLVASDDSRFVYLSVPAGYEVESLRSVPQFWLPIAENRSVYNFELRRKTQDDTHHGFIVVADPQIWARKEFPMLAEAMDDIRTTVADYDIPFHGMCCGDIISFDHTFYPIYNQTAERSGLTFFNTPGNHDMTLYGRTFETTLSKYEDIYGPSCYSFNVGKAHYVVLDDNFYIGRDYFYIGYIDERQFRWLERDLSYVPEGSTVFLMLHIPTTLSPSDRERFKYDNISHIATNARHLHKLLAPYDAHILSGHMHTTSNQIVTDRLYEHNIPALSGAWWQGTLCTDGTPRGYGVFEIDGDEVTWYYKSTDHPADHQLRVYYGATYPQFEGQLVADIWASDPSWRVEAAFDEEAPQPMERFTTYDPAAQKMYADTSHLDHKYIYPSKADHFYRATIPAGARKAQITATDRFGRTYTQIIEFAR